MYGPSVPRKRFSSICRFAPSAGERNDRGQDRAQQGGERRWLDTSRSALHQVDVFDRDGAAIAIEGDENGEPDRGLGGGHSQQQTVLNR